MNRGNSAAKSLDLQFLQTGQPHSVGQGRCPGKPAQRIGKPLVVSFAATTEIADQRHGKSDKNLMTVAKHWPGRVG